jgi:acyl-coenzyme A thioesterase PaaI-like protein
MEKLFNLIQKAQSSRPHLWLLNRLMNHAVPFNKPHGFQVLKISETSIQTFAPCHKKNFNHVRGIHACAIATVGELSAGLMLMHHFSQKKYRIIMSQIQIDYHYQAKKNITATAQLSPIEKTTIMEALSSDHKTSHTLVTEIRDDDQVSIATVKSTWQIKCWDQVKTKL